MAQELSDQNWADLIARRAREGIYGVLTTGIYCRYACAAPLPLRRNCLAFDTATAARASGLRACKRCDPG